MFASLSGGARIRAADMSDRSPWGDFWFNPVGRGGAAPAVNDGTAMTLSAVWRGCNLISSHLAMLPLRMRKEGSLEQVRGHWLQALFRRPNAWQNGFEWRQMCQLHLLLRGNAYNEIVDDARGRITALIPRHPDFTRVLPVPGGGGDWYYEFRDPTSGVVRNVSRGQVWHLRGLSNNGVVGMSVISAAAESLGLSLNAQGYGNRYFANDGRPSGGWIEYPGKIAGKEQRTALREGFQEQQAGANRGRILILDQGMKYHDPVGISAQDSQFLETRKIGVNEVARWLGLPPHKLADLSAATNNNIEMQAMEYIGDTLMPWAELWEAAIENELLLEGEPLDPEFDFSRLERADSRTRAEVGQKHVYAGTLTRNEVRAAEGRPPLPGLDEPLVPVNMTLASLVGQQGAKPGAAPVAPINPQDDDAPLAPEQKEE